MFTGPRTLACGLCLLLVVVALIPLVEPWIDGSHTPEDLEPQDERSALSTLSDPTIDIPATNITTTDIPVAVFPATANPAPSYGARAGDGDHPLVQDRVSLIDRDEIAIAFLEEEGGGRLWVYDDARRNLKRIHSGSFEAQHSDGGDMQAGDLDGDGLDELVISAEIYVQVENKTVERTAITIKDDATTKFATLSVTYLNATGCSVAVGDLDGDDLDEVAVVGKLEDDRYMAGAVFDDLLAGTRLYHLWDPISAPWDELLYATTDHDITAGDRMASRRRCRGARNAHLRQASEYGVVGGHPAR